jgi:hypothetical protein
MIFLAGCSSEQSTDTSWKPIPAATTESLEALMPSATESSPPMRSTAEQSESPVIPKDFLTVDAARAHLQAWADSHPFQFLSELEPESDDHIADGEEYYIFNLSIIRLGVAEILVHKETGELFHLSSPGNTTFEQLDDWYEKERAAYDAIRFLTAEEARKNLQVWLDEHPLQPPATLAREYDEYSEGNDEYYLFSPDDMERYWLNFLVHKETSELLFLLTPDGLDPTPTIEPLDEWYHRSYGDTYGEAQQNEFLSEVSYKGIPVGLILDEQPESTLGASLKSHGPYYTYDGMELYYTDYVSNVWGFDLSLFEIDGITLDKTRAELIAVFGSPVEYYEYPDYVYKAGDPHTIRYHIFSYIMEGYMIDIWFEAPDEPAYSLGIMRMGQ